MARQALEAEELGLAAEHYGRLIKDRQMLETVVEELESAVERIAEAPPLWQTLGDAYMKLGRTKQAARAYNQGMKETEVLDSARQALAVGDQQRAATQYGVLIKRGTQLKAVIEDLENAVAEDDDAAAIWQALGDAYMKADRLDDSIRAYRKGMESV